MPGLAMKAIEVNIVCISGGHRLPEKTKIPVHYPAKTVKEFIQSQLSTEGILHFKGENIEAKEGILHSLGVKDGDTLELRKCKKMKKTPENVNLVMQPSNEQFNVRLPPSCVINHLKLVIECETGICPGRQCIKKNGDTEVLGDTIKCTRDEVKALTITDVSREQPHLDDPSLSQLNLQHRHTGTDLKTFPSLSPDQVDKSPDLGISRSTQELDGSPVGASVTQDVPTHQTEGTSTSVEASSDGDNSPPNSKSLRDYVRKNRVAKKGTSIISSVPGAKQVYSSQKKETSLKFIPDNKSSRYLDTTKPKPYQPQRPSVQRPGVRQSESSRSSSVTAGTKPTTKK